MTDNPEMAAFARNLFGRPVSNETRAIEPEPVTNVTPDDSLAEFAHSLFAKALDPLDN